MTDEQREELRRNIASGKFESWLVGRARIVLDEKTTEGYTRWKGNLIARHLGVKVGQVWCVMRRNGIDLQRRRSWCVSLDPEFVAKAVDIVGLYLLNQLSTSVR